MGMGQLVFQLPEIDRLATRERVEEALETARIYKTIGFVPREVKTTPSYDPRFHGSTNAISKPTEDTGAWNADTEERMRINYERVMAAVSRLWARERKAIELAYLSEEEMFDFNICAEMGISDRTLRRVKSEAIYNLAFRLRLAVMIDSTQPEQTKGESA